MPQDLPSETIASVNLIMEPVLYENEAMECYKWGPKRRTGESHQPPDQALARQLIILPPPPPTHTQQETLRGEFWPQPSVYMT